MTGGGLEDVSKEAGIIPRVIADIFTRVSDSDSVGLSFLEVLHGSDNCFRPFLNEESDWAMYNFLDVLNPCYEEFVKVLMYRQ